MDRFGAVAGEQREVMHLARRAGLDDEAGRRAQALAAPDAGGSPRSRAAPESASMVGVDACGRTRSGCCSPSCTASTACAHSDASARFDAFLAPRDRIADVELVRLELAAGVSARCGAASPCRRSRGSAATTSSRIGGLMSSMPSRFGLRADERHQRHHQLFADRIDRRVGDLREQLLEVVVQRLVLVRQHRQRRVVAHRAGRLPRRARAIGDIRTSGLPACSRTPAGDRAAARRAPARGARRRAGRRA